MIGQFFCIGMVLIVTSLTGGCASSHVLIGTPRAPIDPVQVKMYAVPPAKFEQIAIVEASSKNSWAMGDQGKMNKVIARLKKRSGGTWGEWCAAQGCWRAKYGNSRHRR